MKTMHLFAGVGGGLLADLVLGHDPIIAVEWDGYACQVLRERAAEGWFPNLRVWEGDVRMFDPSEYAGKLDCIHAGFPCQDISIAGNQKGVGHETRSGLYREVLRIAGIVRPRYLFLENVAAILGNGLGTVLADLAAMGFDAEWGCLRASDCGAPHHRDRWWLLADSRRDGYESKRIRGIGISPSSSMQGKAREQRIRTEAANGSEDVADPKCARQQGQGEPIESIYSAPTKDWETDWTIDGGQGIFGWWDIESKLDRVANGVPHRVHRLKGLGNAQVPLQAAVAWKLLGGP